MKRIIIAALLLALAAALAVTAVAETGAQGEARLQTNSLLFDGGDSYASASDLGIEGDGVFKDADGVLYQVVCRDMSEVLTEDVMALLTDDFRKLMLHEAITGYMDTIGVADYQVEDITTEAGIGVSLSDVTMLGVPISVAAIFYGKDLWMVSGMPYSGGDASVGVRDFITRIVPVE